MNSYSSPPPYLEILLLGVVLGKDNRVKTTVVGQLRPIVSHKYEYDKGRTIFSKYFHINHCSVMLLKNSDFLSS